MIAGEARGRVLKAPAGLALRPTTDKVKGAIFSMVSAEAYRRDQAGGFPYRRALDLYAGTGALGIEALSRGAEWVDFVEYDARAREIIQENLRRTGFAARGKIVGLRAEAALSTLRTPYDLILLDPPYDDPAIPDLFQTLGHSPILSDRTLVVLEHSRRTKVPDQAGRLVLSRTRYHGETAISLFEANGDGRT